MAAQLCQECKQAHPGRVCDYDEKGECAETIGVNELAQTCNEPSKDEEDGGSLRFGATPPMTKSCGKSPEVFSMIEVSVKCKYCDKHILLPVSKPPEKAQHQLALTLADPLRNVLCPHCKLVYSYEAHMFYLHRMDPGSPRKDQVLICIEMKCDEPNCACRARVFAATKMSETLRKDAKDLLSGVVAFELLCDNGHQQAGGCFQDEPIAIFLSGGWKK